MPNTIYLGINVDTDQIFVRRMNNDGITEIKTYSPLEYGLYYSNVGKDVEKNDYYLHKCKKNITFAHAFDNIAQTFETF